METKEEEPKEETNKAHWRYGIVLHKGEYDEVLGVHEIYYNSRNELCSRTDDPIIVGNDKEELLRVLDRMKEAVAGQEKILTDEDFGHSNF